MSWAEKHRQLSKSKILTYVITAEMCPSMPMWWRAADPCLRTHMNDLSNPSPTKLNFVGLAKKQYLPSPSPVLYCLFMPSPFWLVPPATYFYHLRKPPPHESRNHLNHLRITTPKRIKPYCCAKFLARSTLHRRAHGSTPVPCKARVLHTGVTGPYQNFKPWYKRCKHKHHIFF